MAPQTIPVIQLGIGGVGTALLHQTRTQAAMLAARYGVALAYYGIADSTAALVGAPLATAQLDAAVAARATGAKLVSFADATPGMLTFAMLPPPPALLVDVTASDATVPLLTAAMQAGYGVVLANKRPLSGDRAIFAQLTAHGTTWYEATVGAGLPVISTLQALLATGDEVQRIEASLSGTLGYLCSALADGTPLSAALAVAQDNGWTEPDPRDDLSGADVARKALILARTCGLPWTLDDIPATPLFPPELASGSVAAFLAALPAHDGALGAQSTAARAAGATLRYSATITPGGAQVAMQPVPLAHPLAALRGTDNLIAFTTTRYPSPLVVQGAGAGTAVTAAGVLGDMLVAARTLAAR